MPPKVKAEKGTKAKAKAASKEEAKKAKVIKGAAKGKHTSSLTVLFTTKILLIWILI